MNLFGKIGMGVCNKKGQQKYVILPEAIIILKDYDLGWNLKMVSFKNSLSKCV